MSNTTTANAVAVTAPKISNAWVSVVKASTVADAKISQALGASQSVIDAQTELVTTAILKLASVISTESGLSIRDAVKVIKETGGESSFIKVSHIQGLPTLLAMRSSVEGFTALPIAKQLSTATASVELLGTGNGEQLKTAEILTKEIATMRQAKNAKRSTAKGDAPKSKVSNLDAIKAFTALASTLNFDELSDAEAHALSELSIVLESMSAIA